MNKIDGFTPGPWVRDELFMEDDRRVRVGTTDGTATYYHKSATICECVINTDDREDGEPMIGVVTAEKNALLISLAPLLPEMAEALRPIIDSYGLGQTPAKFCANVHDFMLQAREILARYDAAVKS